MTSPAPGWYPDPHVPQQMRWWDGRAWTDDTYERTIPLDAGLGTSAGSSHATGSEVQPGGAATSPRRSAVGAERLAVTDDGALLAGWGRRAVARVLDGIVVSMLALLVA